MNFVKAKPVWPEALEREKNITCSIWNGFHHADEKVVLRITGCSLYRAFLNGTLIAYGPARAMHRHFRIDEWELTALCVEGHNALYIETAGYNVNTFYTLDQPSFIQAELQQGEEVTAATGCCGFSGRVVEERVRKTPKYSFQRPFTEAWKLNPDYMKGYYSAPEKPCVFTVQPDVQYLTRNVQYPEFTRVRPAMITASGAATDGHKREVYRRDRSLTNISPVLKGYPMDELEINLNDLAQEFDYVPDEKSLPMDEEIRLKANHYAVFGYKTIDAGFPAFHVECEEDVTLWMIWDEILRSDGDVEYNRHFECVNAMRIELKAGSYDFTGFEAYVYMGMKFIAMGGSCTISDVRLIEYAAPIPNAKACPVDDPDVKKIYDAAVNSYRLCCLESYMDDPSRERNDCLFDSYFMSQAEYLLTGSHAVNHNMMEAYCLASAGNFKPLRDDQVPMMYPADHYDGLYSPTHQMWLVIQFNEYVRNSGDHSLVEPFRERIYKGYEYFKTFMNTDGLLEKLTGWVFIDWQEANDAAGAADVSYVANMIYARMLDAMYELYTDRKLAAEADNIRKVIRAQSLRNGVFHDIAVRDSDGQLKLTDVVTQACQSYALFLGVADGTTDPDVANSMITVPDGMSHQHSLTQPIRLACVLKCFGKDVFLSELKKAYLYQAVKTGSLWEDDTPERNLIESIHAEILALFEEFR